MWRTLPTFSFKQCSGDLIFLWEQLVYSVTGLTLILYYTNLYSAPLSYPVCLIINLDVYCTVYCKYIERCTACFGEYNPTELSPTTQCTLGWYSFRVYSISVISEYKCSLVLPMMRTHRTQVFVKPLRWCLFVGFPVALLIVHSVLTKALTLLLPQTRNENHNLQRENKEGIKFFRNWHKRL